MVCPQQMEEVLPFDTGLKIKKRFMFLSIKISYRLHKIAMRKVIIIMTALLQL